MLQLLAYLKPHRRSAFFAVICMLVVVAADLWQPTLMAQIVDQGIFQGNLKLILHTGAMMVAVALVGALGGMAGVYFSSATSLNFGTDVRAALFEKVQGFSFTNLDQFKTASLITRLTNDVAQIQTMVLMMLRIFIRAPILLVGSLGMTLLINAKLAVVLLFTVPVLALSVLFVVRKGLPLFVRVQQALDQINTAARENLAGVRVIKAFARADYEKRRFGQKNRDLTAVTIKAARTMALLMPLMMLIMNTSILAVLWFGGRQVNFGTMLVGQVIAFTNYMTLILFSLMMASFILMMASRAKVSGDRILEVLKTGTTIEDGKLDLEEPITRGEIVFQNVSFQYPGAAGPPVLQDINFRIQPGETMAILGATGAGKSTLINLIPRFYDVTQGQILIDGIDVRDMKLARLREIIGLVPQEAVLFSGTIRANIGWGLEDPTDAQVQAAAEMAQAHQFIDNLPQKYDTPLAQQAVNLSGGQKQRLTIARAVIKNPVILILDDSTSAIDLQTEALLQRALRRHLAGCTTIIVAQRVSSVMQADKILVLEDGRITGMGDHASLIKNCPVYQEIYRSQQGEEAVQP